MVLLMVLELTKVPALRDNLCPMIGTLWKCPPAHYPCGIGTRIIRASRQARPSLALRIGIPDILLVNIIGEEVFAVPRIS
jgi:hypothetical protein